MAKWEVNVDLKRSSRSGSVSTVSPLRAGTASDNSPVHGGSAVSVVPIRLGTAQELRADFQGCLDKAFHVFEELHFFKPGIVTFSTVNDAVFLLFIGIRGESNGFSNVSAEIPVSRPLSPYDINAASNLNTPRVNILRPNTVFDPFQGYSHLFLNESLSRPIYLDSSGSTNVTEKDTTVKRSIKVTVDPLEQTSLSKPGFSLKTIGGAQMITIIPEPDPEYAQGMHSMGTHSDVNVFVSKAFNLNPEIINDNSILDAVKATVKSDLVAEIISGTSSITETFSESYITRNIQGRVNTKSTLATNNFMVDIVAYVNEIKGKSDLTEADFVVDGLASRVLDLNDINDYSEVKEIFSNTIRSIIPHVLNTKSEIATTRIQSSFTFRPKIATSSIISVEEYKAIRNLAAGMDASSEVAAPVNFNIAFPQIVNELGYILSNENGDVITTKQTDFTLNDTVEV